MQTISLIPMQVLACRARKIVYCLPQEPGYEGMTCSVIASDMNFWMLHVAVSGTRITHGTTRF